MFLCASCVPAPQQLMMCKTQAAVWTETTCPCALSLAPRGVTYLSSESLRALLSLSPPSPPPSGGTPLSKRFIGLRRVGVEILLLVGFLARVSVTWGEFRAADHKLDCSSSLECLRDKHTFQDVNIPGSHCSTSTLWSGNGSESRVTQVSGE